MPSPAAQAEPPFVTRLHPTERTVIVPPGQRALVVRAGAPGPLLPPGTHRIRGPFGPAPELYLLPDGVSYFPVRMTELCAADGTALELGWAVEVEIDNPVTLWQNWLRHAEADAIPPPAAPVAAALADCAHELTRCHALADLRADAKVRKDLAGTLSLRLRRRLADFGLVIGAQFDPDALRVHTAADRAAAEKLARDLATDAAVDKIYNAEVVAHKLRGTLEFLGVAVTDAQWAALLQRIHHGEAGQIVAEAIEMAAAGSAAPAAGPSGPTGLSAAPDSGPPPARERWRVLGQLGQVISFGLLLVAAILTAIYFIRPDEMTPDGRRGWTVAMVVGLVVAALIAAWTLDALMHWEAQRQAHALGSVAEIERRERRRMRVRNILEIAVALVGVIFVAVGLWHPAYFWLEDVAQAAAGLLIVLFIVYFRHMRTRDRAARTVYDARRLAGALSKRDRKLFYARAVAHLQGELEVLRGRLGAAAGLAFRERHDLPLTQRLRKLEECVKQMPERVQALHAPKAQADGATWDAVDAAIERMGQALAGALQHAGALESELRGPASGAQGNGQPPTAEALAQALREFDEELTRWRPITV